MPNPDQSSQSRRGLLWLLFRAPGALILWWQYHFPKEGEVWASARRKGKPIFEILYSLGFWVTVSFFLWGFVQLITFHG